MVWQGTLEEIQHFVAPSEKIECELLRKKMRGGQEGIPGWGGVAMEDQEYAPVHPRVVENLWRKVVASEKSFQWISLHASYLGSDLVSLEAPQSFLPGISLAP